MNPIIPVIGLFGLIFLIARLTKRKPESSKVPDSVKEIIANPDAATPAQLEQASQDAAKAGLKETADILENKAEVIREIESEESETKNQPVFKSPISGVSADAYTKYVLSSKSGQKDTITPYYGLGYFLMGMRTLEDFGYVTNVKKTDYNGKQVWQGEWKEPYSLEKFLSDAALQYEAFSKMTKNHANAIRNRYSDYLGKTILGQKVTLSGLLGVAKQAGLGGLDKWLTNKDARKGYTNTAFEKSNGYF